MLPRSRTLFIGFQFCTWERLAILTIIWFEICISVFQMQCNLPKNTRRGFSRPSKVVGGSESKKSIRKLNMYVYYIMKI